MTTAHVLALLSVVLAAVVVAVLATALIGVRRGLHEISTGLNQLGGALARPSEGAGARATRRTST